MYIQNGRICPNFQTWALLVNARWVTSVGGRLLHSSLRVETVIRDARLTTPRSVHRPAGRSPAAASLIERSAARCATTPNVFTCKVQLSLDRLCDSAWLYFLKKPLSLLKDSFLSVAVCQSISVRSCRGGLLVILENLHFLAMKRNCIVYETTKSTQSKPYNSILCHFFCSVLIF